VPGQHSTGGYADIGAVEVGSDALGQLGDHVLAQAGVRTGCTGLRAFEAGLDTASQLCSVNVAKILRVGVQHRLNM
jgi:hypothetical protein